LSHQVRRGTDIEAFGDFEHSAAQDAAADSHGALLNQPAWFVQRVVVRKGARGICLHEITVLSPKRNVVSIPALDPALDPALALLWGSRARGWELNLRRLSSRACPFAEVYKFPNHDPCPHRRGASCRRRLAALLGDRTH
jgi:hypothetical protein